MRNEQQRSFYLQFLNRAHAWIRIWLIGEVVTRNREYLTLYWSSSTIITSNDEQQYITWMEKNMDQSEWIYETPFGGNVNDANWCPIFLSSWIEEKVDDQSKVSNHILLLIPKTKFSMHGSPSYWNTSWNFKIFPSGLHTHRPLHCLIQIPQRTWLDLNLTCFKSIITWSIYYISGLAKI